jgi:hypothetical protein
MDAKIKHLEFIQSVINRMASNSFFIKGWTVVLVSALFVLSGKESKIYFVYLAYFPVITFWILDGYFLWQERLFRRLYNDVRNYDEDKIDFSLNTKEIKKEEKTWIDAIFSTTLLIFHLTVLVSIVIVMCFFLL